MNLEPKKLFEMSINDSEFIFTKQYYAVDDSAAIVIEEKEDGYCVPYGVLTVNLHDYGMIPVDGGVFINHDMKDSDIFKAFYEKYCDKDFGLQNIYFGMASSYEVKLLPNIL